MYISWLSSTVQLEVEFFINEPTWLVQLFSLEHVLNYISITCLFADSQILSTAENGSDSFFLGGQGSN